MLEQVTWRFMPMGETALLVQAHPSSSLAHRSVLALTAALDQVSQPGVAPSVPGIDTVLIQFDPLQLSLSALTTQVQQLLDDLEPVADVPTRIVHVPVHYGGVGGPDLDEVAQRLGMTPREVVAEHSNKIGRVLLIGFAPGFPYVGGLSPRLVLPRRATPRTAVPAGSVAIAADMTGIYPTQLPGGWHIIGRTTLQLFDPTASPPTLLLPGDGVRFEPQSGGVVP
jgi:KipI family sensor histidine kinase inhibitor